MSFRQLGRAPPAPFEPDLVFPHVAAFVRLSRLKFLAGGFVGAGFGTAIAAYETGTVHWKAYAVAQATITSFHLMTHYANDYYDRACDAHARRTPFSGGSGALVDGSLPPRVGLVAALTCAAGGTLGIVALLALHANAAAAFAVAIALLAWCYSAPPLRLLARGLGELDTAVVVGVLVPLCAYAAQAGLPSARALASTLPTAAAMLAMMLAVEYPDLAADEATGKRNLVVRFGAERAKPLGVAAACAVYGAVALALAYGAPLEFVRLEALTLPLGIAFAVTMVRHTARNPRADATLAGRGVAFFFLVASLGLVAYAAATPRNGGDGSGAFETNGILRAVAGSVIDSPTLEARVGAALDEVRPGILRDGGDVWLIRIDTRVAYVQMVGACGGCAMSTATLKGAIEGAVLARCPEIDRVEQI